MSWLPRNLFLEHATKQIRLTPLSNSNPIKISYGDPFPEVDCDNTGLIRTCASAATEGESDGAAHISTSVGEIPRDGGLSLPVRGDPLSGACTTRNEHLMLHEYNQHHVSPS